ncbi:MAG: futalosine hydrolase [Phycisphaerales bacterium JB065]
MTGVHPTPSRLLEPLRSGKRILLVVAAPTEATAVVHGVTGIRPEHPQIAWNPLELDERCDLLISGVGKANAAGATGRVLNESRHDLVISLGIGGALPAPQGEHAIGDIVRCERSVFADEGVHLPDSGWATMADRKFGPRQGLTEEHSMAIDTDSRALELLERSFPALGSAATVSACSGTNEAARTIVARTGCTVEAMEGAAIGLSVLRTCPAIPFLELRVISNRTGDDQGWDLPLALRRLSELASAL